MTSPSTIRRREANSSRSLDMRFAAVAHALLRATSPLMTMLGGCRDAQHPRVRAPRLALGQLELDVPFVGQFLRALTVDEAERRAVAAAFDRGVVDDVVFHPIAHGLE